MLHVHMCKGALDFFGIKKLKNPLRKFTTLVEVSRLCLICLQMNSDNKVNVSYTKRINCDSSGSSQAKGHMALYF